ncbi:MAG TPA: ABC transporter permease [Candidatus Sulfotelmatobacter sp.]|nr:ABC transporter permease [Candidatus Sulfotelmatobacter sp.]
MTAARRLWAASYPLVLLVVVWEAAARAGLARPLFLPAFSTVVAQLWPLLQSGDVIEPLLRSVLRALGGLALAAACGIALGIAMARVAWFHWLLDPLVAIAFPAPKIAFVPIFILWFGIGDLSKVLLVAFTCVFPMLVSAYDGARGVSLVLLWSARSMGASPRHLLWQVILPGALPAILAGLRVTVPVSLIVAFTAEMVEGGGGVGAALMYAQRFFETPTVFVYIVLMLLTGVAVDAMMARLRRRVLRWHEDAAPDRAGRQE